jgi:hypothetical protein
MKVAAFVIQLIALALMAFPALGQSANTKSVFSEIIERRKAKVKSLSVRIMPEKTTIASEEKKLKNGKTQVLSIPVALENWFSDEITSTISHEWYGGIHPPTDLYAAVRVLFEGKEIWNVQHVYLQGELGTSEGVTTLLPGGKKNLLIRLNWPGTGSVSVEPLIKATDVGEHMLKFFLLFISAGDICYVETPEIKIQVESASSGK